MHRYDLQLITGGWKMLVKSCIEKASREKHLQLIIHTTRAMCTAWKMSESLDRSTDLDFKQGELDIFGFRLNLNK